MLTGAFGGDKMSMLVAETPPIGGTKSLMRASSARLLLYAGHIGDPSCVVIRFSVKFIMMINKLSHAAGKYTSNSLSSICHSSTITALGFS